MADSARRSLETGGHGGVFYLHGDDEFRKAEYARSLVEAHLDPSVRDFNYDRLRGSEVDVERLASILATPPMMAEWRVVLLTETEGLAASSRARDLLVSTAGSPPPGLALVLVASTDSKAKFYKTLASKARAVRFDAVAPDDVPVWLVERAREVHGLDMDEDAARKLGSAVGADLGVLARELEKLASVVEEGAVIDRAAVEAAGTVLPRQDRWEWFDAVGERRFEEALDGVTILLDHGESGVGLVIGLATHLLRLGVVKERGAQGLEEAVPPNQKWMVRKFLGRRLAAQARGWPTAELEAAILGLLRVDRLLKSAAGGVGERALLEEWLLGRMARSRGVAA